MQLCTVKQPDTKTKFYTSSAVCVCVVGGGGGADYCDYVLHYGHMLFDSMCAIMFISPGSGHSPDSPAQEVLVS